MNLVLRLAILLLVIHHVSARLEISMDSWNSYSSYGASIRFAFKSDSPSIVQLNASTQFTINLPDGLEIDMSANGLNFFKISLEHPDMTFYERDGTSFNAPICSGSPMICTFRFASIQERAIDLQHTLVINFSSFIPTKPFTLHPTSELAFSSLSNVAFSQGTYTAAPTVVAQPGHASPYPSQVTFSHLSRAALADRYATYSFQSFFNFPFLADDKIFLSLYETDVLHVCPFIFQDRSLIPLSSLNVNQTFESEMWGQVTPFFNVKVNNNVVSAIATAVSSTSNSVVLQFFLNNLTKSSSANIVIEFYGCSANLSSGSLHLSVRHVKADTTASTYYSSMVYLKPTASPPVNAKHAVDTITAFPMQFVLSRNLFSSQFEIAFPPNPTAGQPTRYFLSGDQIVISFQDLKNNLTLPMPFYVMNYMLRLDCLSNNSPVEVVFNTQLIQLEFLGPVSTEHVIVCDNLNYPVVSKYGQKTPFMHLPVEILYGENTFSPVPSKFFVKSSISLDVLSGSVAEVTDPVKISISPLKSSPEGEAAKISLFVRFSTESADFRISNSDIVGFSFHLPLFFGDSFEVESIVVHSILLGDDKYYPFKKELKKVSLVSKRVVVETTQSLLNEITDTNILTYVSAIVLRVIVRNVDLCLSLPNSIPDEAYPTTGLYFSQNTAPENYTFSYSHQTYTYQDKGRSCATGSQLTPHIPALPSYAPVHLKFRSKLRYLDFSYIPPEVTTEKLLHSVVHAKVSFELKAYIRFSSSTLKLQEFPTHIKIEHTPSLDAYGMLNLDPSIKSHCTVCYRSAPGVCDYRISSRVTGTYQNVVPKLNTNDGTHFLISLPNLPDSLETVEVDDGQNEFVVFGVLGHCEISGPDSLMNGVVRTKNAILDGEEMIQSTFIFQHAPDLPMYSTLFNVLPDHGLSNVSMTIEQSPFPPFSFPIRSKLIYDKLLESQHLTKFTLSADITLNNNFLFQDLLQPTKRLAVEYHEPSTLFSPRIEKFLTSGSQVHLQCFIERAVSQTSNFDVHDIRLTIQHTPFFPKPDPTQNPSKNSALFVFQNAGVSHSSFPFETTATGIKLTILCGHSVGQFISQGQVTFTPFKLDEKSTLLTFGRPIPIQSMALYFLRQHNQILDSLDSSNSQDFLVVAATYGTIHRIDPPTNEPNNTLVSVRRTHQAYGEGSSGGDLPISVLSPSSIFETIIMSHEVYSYYPLLLPGNLGLKMVPGPTFYIDESAITDAPRLVGNFFISNGTAGSSKSVKIPAYLLFQNGKPYFTGNYHGDPRSDRVFFSSNNGSYAISDQIPTNPTQFIGFQPGYTLKVYFRPTDFVTLLPGVGTSHTYSLAQKSLSVSANLPKDSNLSFSQTIDTSLNRLAEPVLQHSIDVYGLSLFMKPLNAGDVEYSLNPRSMKNSQTQNVFLIDMSIIMKQIPIITSYSTFQLVWKTKIPLVNVLSQNGVAWTATLTGDSSPSLEGTLNADFYDISGGQHVIISFTSITSDSSPSISEMIQHGREAKYYSVTFILSVLFDKANVGKSFTLPQQLVTYSHLNTVPKPNTVFAFSEYSSSMTFPIVEDGSFVREIHFDQPYLGMQTSLFILVGAAPDLSAGAVLIVDIKDLGLTSISPPYCKSFSPMIPLPKFPYNSLPNGNSPIGCTFHGTKLHIQHYPDIALAMYLSGVAIFIPGFVVSKVPEKSEIDAQLGSDKFLKLLTPTVTEGFPQTATRTVFNFLSLSLVPLTKVPYFSPISINIHYPAVGLSFEDYRAVQTLSIKFQEISLITNQGVIMSSLILDFWKNGVRYSYKTPLAGKVTDGLITVSFQQDATLSVFQTLNEHDSFTITITKCIYLVPVTVPLQSPLTYLKFQFEKQFVETNLTSALPSPLEVFPTINTGDVSGVSVKMAVSSPLSAYPVVGTIAPLLYTVPIPYCDLRSSPQKYYLVPPVPKGFVLDWTTSSNVSQSVPCQLFSNNVLVQALTLFRVVSNSQDFIQLIYDVPMDQSNLVTAVLKCTLFGYVSEQYRISVPSTVKFPESYFGHLSIVHSSDDLVTFTSFIKTSPSSSQISNGFVLPKVSIPAITSSVTFSPGTFLAANEMKITLANCPIYVESNDTLRLPFPAGYYPSSNSNLSCVYESPSRFDGFSMLNPVSVPISGSIITASGPTAARLTITFPKLIGPTVSHFFPSLLPQEPSFIICQGVQFSQSSQAGVSYGMTFTSSSEQTLPITPVLYRNVDSTTLSLTGGTSFSGIFPASILSSSVNFDIRHSSGFDPDYMSEKDSLHLGSISFNVNDFAINNVQAKYFTNFHLTVEMPPGFRTRSYSTSYTSSDACTYRYTTSSKPQSGPYPAHLLVTSKTPTSKFPAHQLRIDFRDLSAVPLAQNDKLTLAIQCTGFGVPVYAPPSSSTFVLTARYGGGSVEDGHAHVIGSSLATSSAIFTQYTVSTGSTSTIASFSPPITKTIGSFSLSLNPFRLVGMEHSLEFDLPPGFIITSSSNVNCIVSHRSPVYGFTNELRVISQTITGLHISLEFSTSTAINSFVSATDIIQVTCNGIISPDEPSFSHYLDLGIIAKTKQYTATQDTVFFEGLAAKTNELSLKNILVDPNQGSFSVYISEVVNGIPLVGGKFVFSLPDLIGIVSTSLVKCFLRKHDGSTFKNEIIETDIPATSTRVDDFLTSLPVSEIDLFAGDDASTQTTRHRVTVYFDEGVAASLTSSPYGYSIQCTGATPQSIELFSSETYYIQVFEKLEQDIENPQVSYFSAIASTSTATLVSTHAASLSPSVIFSHSSQNAGDLGEIQIDIEHLTTSLIPSDVVEITFPPSSAYEFNIPLQGKKIPALSQQQSTDSTPISTCTLFRITYDENDEALEKEPINNVLFITEISSVSLFQSTITAASAAASLTGAQPLVLSIRLSPTPANNDIELTNNVLVDFGETLVIKCANVGFPAKAVDQSNSFQSTRDLVSVSLYRSLQEEIQSGIMVDTLLVRRAFNDDIPPPIFGPQRLKLVRFFTGSPTFNSIVDISIEMQLTRSVSLTTESPRVSLHLEVPIGWHLSSKTTCILSIGSAYREDASITGDISITIIPENLELDQRDALVFTFVTPFAVLRQSERLHLFCSNVKMPSKNMLLHSFSYDAENQNDDVLRYATTATVSFISPGKNDLDVHAQSDTAICPVISSSSGPSQLRTINIFHTFTSAKPFGLSEIEIWQETFENLSGIRGKHAIGFHSIAQQRTDRPVVSSSSSSSSSSGQYYEVVISATLTAPQKWLETEQVYTDLTSQRTLTRIMKSYSTYYDAGIFSHEYSLGTAPSSCYNSKIDADLGEIDVDCGGICVRCGIGRSCVTDENCVGNKCESNICVDASSASSLQTMMSFIFIFSLFFFL